MECVIYCRVSSESQTKGHGLQRQLERGLKYANERGYLVAAVFSEVMSGVESLYVRGQVERMAKVRGCVIVCEAPDRWSRAGADDVAPRNVEWSSEFQREMDAQMVEMFPILRFI